MNQYLKCTEYVGDYYGIQPTAGGEYIVRQRDGRELSRWPTIDEARGDAQQRQAQDVQDREERIQLWAVDREFGAAHRDLTDAQLRWQDWRNWFYDALVHEDRRLGRQEKALGKVPEGAAGQYGTTGSPSYVKYDRDYIDGAKRQAEARQVYERTVALDAQIKAARREQDIHLLTARLMQAERMILDMRGYYQGQPDDGRQILNRGEVHHDGQLYDLVEDATPTNRAFPGGWGDASEGEFYTAEYGAAAVDQEGKPVKVVWQFDETKGREPEDESNYPWDDEHISNVVPQ